MNERVLVWAGCTNVRDLGGLSTSDGRMTRWGAVVRSDTPPDPPAGWSALCTWHPYNTRYALSMEGDSTLRHLILVSTVQVTIRHY
jgi:hypothetical protein